MSATARFALHPIMNSGIANSKASSPSFACVNPPLAAESQSAQSVHVPEYSQHMPTVSSLRQKILEASETLGTIAGKRRTPINRRSKATDTATPVNGKSSKSRKQRSITATGLDSNPRLNINKRQRSNIELSTKSSQLLNDAVISTVYNPKGTSLATCPSGQPKLPSKDTSLQRKNDVRDLADKISTHTQAHVSGLELADIEEDDAWFNLHQQIGTDENAIADNFHIVPNQCIDRVTFSRATSALRETNGSLADRHYDDADELTKFVKALGSDDEFPMDNDVLEEATNQAEQLDQHLQCHNEDNRPSSTPQESTASQGFECSSDVSNNNVILAETATGVASSEKDGSTAPFAATSSTPMTPPPKPGESVIVVQATSSPTKEDDLNNALHGVFSLGSPEGCVSGTFGEEPLQNGSPSSSGMISQALNSTGTESPTPLSATTTLDSSKAICERQEDDSTAAPRPLEDLDAPLTPFVRSSVPEPMPRLCLLPSATPDVRMLTCFRTPAILKAVSTPSTNAPHLFLEAYCLVIDSVRQGHRQQFVFADLFFPDTCPRLTGTYEGWQGSELWEHDTSTFLAESRESPKMCRAIITSLPRNGDHNSITKDMASSINHTQVMNVQVLNIWEACWEDVRFVKGIAEA